MRYIDVAQSLVFAHPFITAAVLTAVVLLLMWWVAERQFRETITQMPGDEE